MNISTTQQEEEYMQRCLELARLGCGNTSPNPMVGAVVVYDNKIIGEGFHHQCGEAHAEVNAINAVKDKSLLSKSTIYVSLEPCSHTGKTPPCADLIIKHKIPRIIIGCVDTFSKVAGEGIKRIKDTGAFVKVGVLENECREINKRFFTFHEQKRPYIILKWAETKDGFIDIARNEHSLQQPTWITDETARQLVHKWRTEEQAIFVGTNTALFDNPKLNVRSWTGKNPLRVVLDLNLRLPLNLHLFDQSIPTLVITYKEKTSLDNLTYIRIDPKLDTIPQILEILYNLNILSLFVEGGKRTLETFISSNYWDEARVFVGDVLFGEGITTLSFNSPNKEEIGIRNDVLKVYLNHSHPNSKSL